MIKNSDVTFSVAIATYNGELFIRQQIESILTQTIPIDEIVICDDNSTDKTWDILQHLAKEYPIIQTYKNDKNLGYIKNFEKAASLCSGEYILLADQDDIWTKDHVEVLYETLGDKSLACGNASCINKEGSLTGDTLKDTSYQLSGNIQKDFRRYLFVYAQGATMLFRRDLLKKALPFPPNVSHDIWLGFAAYTKGNGFAYTNRIILNYRRWGQNVSITAHETKKINKSNLHNLLFGGKHLFQSKESVLDHLIAYTNMNEIAEILKSELQEAKQFSNLLGSGKKSLWTLKYFFQNHNEIFGTTTRKGMLLRFIRHFILS